MRERPRSERSCEPLDRRNLLFAYTRLDELDDIARMLAKESVCEHVYFGPNSPEETRGYFLPLLEPASAALDRGERPENHVFTLRRCDDGAFVGEAALIPVAYGPGNYTIGYQVDEPHWRKGYGTRACRFLVWYGFDVLRADRLSGDTLASNEGSARVMEKCGFKREGRRRRYYRPRGESADDLLFGLLRDELELDLERLRAEFRPLESGSRPTGSRPTGSRPTG